MPQSEVMKAWRAWLESLGISRDQVEWFMRDYARCCYLQEALYAAGLL